MRSQIKKREGEAKDETGSTKDIYHKKGSV